MVGEEAQQKTWGRSTVAEDICGEDSRSGRMVQAAWNGERGTYS